MKINLLSIMFVCDSCQENAPENCGRPPSEVMWWPGNADLPAGWHCEDCISHARYDDAPQEGQIASLALMDIGEAGRSNFLLKKLTG